MICAFLPAMNKSLHAALVKICTSRGDPLSLLPLLKHTTHHLTVFISTVWSPWAFTKCWWMSVGAIFFCMEEFSDTPLLHVHFHVRCHSVRRHSVRLPFCCCLSHRNKMWWNTDRKVHPLLSYYQYFMMSWPSVIKHTTFRAALIDLPIEIPWERCHLIIWCLSVFISVLLFAIFFRNHT
mgnify:CR=1 FL=1